MQSVDRSAGQRVQRPEDKINHALVLGGKQGIGKDTLLEPVKQAVGPWNFCEVSPQQVLGRFNGFLRSVILRVSEARDLGEFDRFAFYDHLKAFVAAPPDVLRVDAGSSHTQALGISSPGSNRACPQRPCNGGERRWNTMSDWTCH